MLRWPLTIALVAGLLVTAALSPAWATTGPTDLGDAKTISADRGNSPAGCIGQGTTPGCAAETAAACEIWLDMSLCRAVGYSPAFVLRSQEDYWHLFVFHYKEVGQHTLSRADIPAWASALGEESWRPGDLAYDLWFQVCRPSNACMLQTDHDPRIGAADACVADRCEWEVGPRTYVLRSEKHHWRVVNIYIPQWHERDRWVPSWSGGANP